MPPSALPRRSPRRSPRRASIVTIASLALLPAVVLMVPAARAQSTSGSTAPLDCAEDWVHTVSPARPRPGTLFTISLTRRDAASVDVRVPRATVAGEPLHFTRQPAGRWTALAAAPVDTRESLGLRLDCPAMPNDSTVRAIAIASASYPIEKLRVAPQFSAKPDSALEARQRRESERAAAVSLAAHETPRLWTAPFRAPRDSRITSTFGRGREFNGTVTSRHMGTDYAGAVGSPIRAANRGVVRIVDRFFLGGNVVYLDHGEGLVTAYLHLSQHRVAVGDTVALGAIIGLVGATGRVTGPHLHWIARFGRVSVDPQSLLRVTATDDSLATRPAPRKRANPANPISRR